MIQKNKSNIHLFTLIELMVVFGIILILTGISMPTLMKSRKIAQSVYCKNNLKQYGFANDVYSMTWGRFVAWGPDKLSTNLLRWHGKRSVANNTSEYNLKEGLLYEDLRASELNNCPEFTTKIDYLAASAERGGGGYGYNLYVGSNAYFVDDPNSEESYQTGITVAKLSDPSNTVFFADTAMNVDNAGSIQANSSLGTVASYSVAYAPFGVTAKATDTVLQNEPSIHFVHNNYANIVWGDGSASSKRLKWTLDPGWESKSLGFFGSATDNSGFNPLK